MLDFRNADGTDMVPTESVEVSTEKVIIPENTKLLCRIGGVTIEPEGDYNLEMIVVDVTVIQDGEWKGIEIAHKLNVNGAKINPNEKNIDKATAAAEKKAIKAQETLLTYDKLSKGELYAAIKQRIDIMDVGILNRALAGLDFTAKMSIWEMEIKYRDDAGKLQTALNNDGTPKTRSGNWISGVDAKAVALALIAEDANINQQAQNQPNTPLPDPVNLQPAPLTPTPPVQQPQQPNQPSLTDDFDADIPF